MGMLERDENKRHNPDFGFGIDGVLAAGPGPDTRFVARIVPSDPGRATSGSKRRPRGAGYLDAEGCAGVGAEERSSVPVGAERRGCGSRGRASGAGLKVSFVERKIG